jgi:hypothetical protein
MTALDLLDELFTGDRLLRGVLSKPHSQAGPSR